jgi:hypothetical protein
LIPAAGFWRTAKLGGSSDRVRGAVELVSGSFDEFLERRTAVGFIGLFGLKENEERCLEAILEGARGGRKSAVPIAILDGAPRDLMFAIGDHAVGTGSELALALRVICGVGFLHADVLPVGEAAALATLVLAGGEGGLVVGLVDAG